MFVSQRVYIKNFEDEMIRFVKEVQKDNSFRDIYISKELALTPYQAEWLLEEIEADRAEWLIWHRL
jgi:hypothetical protein